MKTLFIVGAFVAELNRFIPAITNRVRVNTFDQRQLAEATLAALKAEQPGVNWVISEDIRDPNEPVKSWAS